MRKNLQMYSFQMLLTILRNYWRFCFLIKDLYRAHYCGFRTYKGFRHLGGLSQGLGFIVARPSIPLGYCGLLTKCSLVSEWASGGVFGFVIAGGRVRL